MLNSGIYTYVMRYLLVIGFNKLRYKVNSRQR